MKTLNPDEQLLLSRFQNLNPKQRKVLIQMLEVFQPEEDLDEEDREYFSRAEVKKAYRQVQKEIEKGQVVDWESVKRSG